MCSYHKGKRISVLVLMITSLCSACGSTEEPNETAVSVISEPLVATPVEQKPESEPITAEEGPDPENLVDVHIIRGTYTLPLFEEEPGFQQIQAGAAAFAEEQMILSSMDDEAEPVGILQSGSYVSLLSDEGNGWTYVESGNVRGFLKTPIYSQIDDAFYIETEEGLSYVSMAAAMPEESTPAEQLLDPVDNPAFSYKKITALQNPAIKEYALSRRDDLGILEERREDARVVGTMKKDGTAYVLENCRDGWLYVESGTVRGFVKANELITGEEALTRMRQSYDWPIYEAVAVIPFEENRAAYYTCTSVDPGRTVREQVREYTQILGRDRTNELEIPETLNGLPIGWSYTCTPDYAHRGWLYEPQKVFNLWCQYGYVYQENVALIEDCFLIACAPTYGNVGDYVTFYLDDGTALPCIIADLKNENDPHYTSYGHILGEEIDVIEAETMKLANPGTEGCVPWWDGPRVCSCVNHGTYQPYWESEKMKAG